MLRTVTLMPLLLVLLASRSWASAEDRPAACRPRIVGEQRLFVVENNGKVETVPAVEGTVSPKEYYDYRSQSSGSGRGQLGTSSLFLYRDMTDPSGEVSLMWIHGKEVRDQGLARVDGLISGLPEGVTIAQGDEPREFRFTRGTEPGEIVGRNLPGPRVAGNWRFKGNTDGGALAGLGHTKNWELEIKVRLMENIDAWEFLYGDGSTRIELDDTKPTYVRPIATTSGESVQLYPQEAGRATYCALADRGVGDLEYTFTWGDETDDTVVVLPSGTAACATHRFCGTSKKCGGTFPRTVRVLVRSTDEQCIEAPSVERLLAVEGDVCFDGVAVRVEGIPIAPTMGPTKLLLHRIPGQFAGMHKFVPRWGLGNGATVKLECCGTGDCSFVVSTYHCPPCSVGANGGFPTLLPPNGFTAGSCAPHFGDPESNSQRMASFHIVVPAGQSTSLPETTAFAPFVVIFGQQGALADWCPARSRTNNCGGPCPPTTCVCNLVIPSSPA